VSSKKGHLFVVDPIVLQYCTFLLAWSIGYYFSLCILYRKGAIEENGVIEYYIVRSNTTRFLSKRTVHILFSRIIP
jgi:hypothetical protein